MVGRPLMIVVDTFDLDRDRSEGTKKGTMPVLIRRRKGWEIAERDATPEAVFLNRRAFVAGGLAIGGVALGAAALSSHAVADTQPDPSAGLYPVKRNAAYAIDGDVTPEALNLNYNNFYEYGTSKHVAEAAKQLEIRPWTVKIGGMVEKPQTIAIDDLLKAMPLEERLYRHRCVEAWSMQVPWSGFPLKALLDVVKPLGSAKYVEMLTFKDPKMAPGQKGFFYPWPYIEGLTIEEAANDLAFMVTGAYGKPLPRVMGAPLRLATPWKYGFKSIKSIVAINLTDKRPETFWAKLGPDEYGFWANVNPDVPHPRWSQASEEVLATGDRRPTVIYNGYGDHVAALYANLKDEKLFM